MLTFTRAGTLGTTYVDGAAENTYTAGFNFSSTDRWSIAQEWDGGTPTDFLTGTIDEVVLWDRALTTDEIGILYNGGQGNPPTAGAYVKITESGGNTIVEEAGATDSYAIVLYSEPTADVQITATPVDEQIDLGNGPGVAITLDFLTGNWNIAQTIIVTANDDDVYEGKMPHTTTITHTAVSGDEDYNGLNIKSVKVDIIDNELTCGDWGYLATDLNRDCYVNLLDFALFASAWLESIQN